MLDTSHALALGIKPEGALPGAGFGEGTSSVGLAKVRAIDLGGFKLSDQLFIAMDDAIFIKVEGVDGAGLLGYEIPKRAVMEIDYAKGMITLIRPSAFKPPAGAVAVPFKFDEHIPMVEATVDGIPGEFEIDTGARSALTVMGPFAEANNLAQRYHATRSATAGYGVGGPARELLARAGELKIGSITIKDPVTLIAGGKRGAGAAARTAGNIGGDLLRRFTLTLDYGHQLLYLQPNPAFATADLFDRSGLWLMREPDGTDSIADVTAGSGGETAGLKPGDRIVAVDGTKTADIPLSDLRDRLKGDPGTRLTLSVLHEGAAAPQDVVLTLSDLI
jgi:membrane-associated protease RseP (regulator of RpoE activity)